MSLVVDGLARLVRRARRTREDDEESENERGKGERKRLAKISLFLLAQQ